MHDVLILIKKSNGNAEEESIRVLKPDGADLILNESESFVINKLIDGLERDEDDLSSVSFLSVRQKQVMDLLSEGLCYKEIADKLHLATGTVKRHLHRIYEKMEVNNKTEAINLYKKLS